MEDCFQNLPPLQSLCCLMEGKIVWLKIEKLSMLSEKMCPNIDPTVNLKTIVNNNCQQETKKLHLLCQCHLLVLCHLPLTIIEIKFSVFLPICYLITQNMPEWIFTQFGRYVWDCLTENIGYV